MLFSRTGASRVLPSNKRLNWELEASGKFFRLGVKATFAVVFLSLVTLRTLPFSMHNSHVHEKHQTSKATRGLRLRATRRTLAIIFTTGANPKVCGAKATEQKKNINLLILTFLALTFPRYVLTFLKFPAGSSTINIVTFFTLFKSAEQKSYCLSGRSLVNQI